MKHSETAVARQHRWLPAVAGSVAFAVACAVFWSFDDPWTLRGDNKQVIFPMNLAAFRLWMSGQVPEWSDGFWSGLPLLADPTSLSLYWPNFIFFTLTPDPHLRAYDLTTAFHAGVLVAGVVSLLRLLGARPTASLLGGLLIFIAPMHVWYASSILTVYAPVAWWPWIFVAAERLSRDGMRLSSFAIGWIALATCATAFPEFALYGGVAGCLWLLSGGEQRLRHRILSTAMLGLGSIALAAPQLVSTAMLLPDTTRGTEDVRSSDFVEIMFSADTVLYPGMDEFVPSFLGIATLIVATMGIRRRPRRVWTLTALAVITFVLALGYDSPLYSMLRSIPGFDMFRNAMKFKLLTELAIVCLAAFGLDYVLRQTWDASARRLALLLVFLAVGEHVTYAALRVPTGRELPGHSDTPFAELYDRMQASGLIRNALNAPHPPVARVSDRTSLRAIPMIDGVPVFGGGPNSLLPKRHRQVVNAYNTYPGPSADEMNYFGVVYDLRSDSSSSDRRLNPCLTLAAQRRVLLIGRQADTCLFVEPNRPRRFVIPAVTRASPSMEAMVQTVLDELSGDDYVLTLEDPQIECAMEPPAHTPVIAYLTSMAIRHDIPIVAPTDEIDRRTHAFGRTDIIDYRPGDFSVRATSNRAAFLLVKESYYDGWVATVDGAQVPIYPAAGLFFAIPIPAGEHEVHLVYRTPGFMTGVRVALGWIVAVCVVMLIGRIYAERRRSRLTGTPPELATDDAPE